jgi:hypothetical protein
VTRTRPIFHSSRYATLARPNVRFGPFPDQVQCSKFAKRMTVRQLAKKFEVAKRTIYYMRVIAATSLAAKRRSASSSK